MTCFRDKWCVIKVQLTVQQQELLLASCYALTGEACVTRPIRASGLENQDLTNFFKHLKMEFGCKIIDGKI